MWLYCRLEIHHYPHESPQSCPCCHHSPALVRERPPPWHDTGVHLGHVVGSMAGQASAPKVPGEIEFGLGRLFWVCMRHVPLDTDDSTYFSTDDVLVYDPYYGDFGPLNIAQICRYCRMLTHKIADANLANKRIYHVCKPQTDTRANSILLCAAWSLICDGKSPEDAWKPFSSVKPALVPYRDASLGPPSYPITVYHCMTGLKKAIEFGWYKHDEFDPDAYEHYERVENGDFNWIVPGKFLAFSGPTQTPIAYVDGVKSAQQEAITRRIRPLCPRGHCP